MGYAKIKMNAIYLFLFRTKDLWFQYLYLQQKKKKQKKKLMFYCGGIFLVAHIVKNLLAV